MTKTRTKVLAAAAILCTTAAATGCVDRNYDLNRFDDESLVTVAEVIETPPFTAILSVEGILGGMEGVNTLLDRLGLTLDDLEDLPAIDLIEETTTLDMPMDTSFIPELNEYAGDCTLTLLLSIENSLPMDADMELELLDVDNNSVFALTPVDLHRTAEGATETIFREEDMTAVINQLSCISTLQLRIHLPAQEGVRLDLSRFVKIQARFKMTGGISIQ